jgi:CHAT domain-containing protein
MFYKALEQGQSPSAALRMAQLSILSELRAGHIKAETLAGPQRLRPDPAYWANFSLSGEP